MCVCVCLCVHECLHVVLHSFRHAFLCMYVCEGVGQPRTQRPHPDPCTRPTSPLTPLRPTLHSWDPGQDPSQEGSQLEGEVSVSEEAKAQDQAGLDLLGGGFPPPLSPCASSCP